MPFTFSHPAAVLPLLFVDKKRFSATALTIGSITPDFEYFANFQHHSLYSHTWLGIFWFDMPLAALLYLLFNQIVKDPLIDHLPPFLLARFVKCKGSSGDQRPQKYLILFTSLLTGIVSHLFWDKITHKSVLLVDESMDFYPFVWDVNSVIGAAIIAVIVWKMPKTFAPEKDSFAYWLGTLLITLLVMVIRSSFSDDLRSMQVTVISGFLIGLLIMGTTYTFLRKATYRTSMRTSNTIV